VSRAVVALLGLVVWAACNDAVTLTVAGDRPVPTAVDAICVGVGDLEPGGVAFGRRYTLEGELASLPQTLRVESGDASNAWAWVRADRGGVAVARRGQRLDFTRGITLVLDRCETGAGGEPTVVGDVVGPANARLVMSNGIGGELAIALGAEPVVIDARDELSITPAPALSGTITDAVAIDVDGDCDDDIVIATDAAAPVVWRRDGKTLVDAGSLGGGTVTALAAADVDRDGDIDLVTGTGDTLRLLRNDGSGAFTADDAALAGEGRVQTISALALGDLDGDGNPDLVVGQAGDPLRAWLGEPGGTGSFLAADAVISAVPLAVTRMQLADVDGDFDPDLIVAVDSAPLRLYIDRAGLLEDQTFVRISDPPIASAIAIGGWDGGCEPDAVIAGADTQSRRGEPGGALEIDGAGPPASDAIMIDIDHDGDLDVLLATAEGVQWLAR
jgi:hypothetical protein